MSKTENISKTTLEKISVCDIMKTNTSKVIQKLESQIPSQFQQYSDLYTSYLHTIDDVYGACYISEKEFFDNLNLDQGILKSIQDYSQTMTDAYMDQIALYAKYRQDVVQMQNSSLKVYDNFLHTLMDAYSKTLSQFNNIVNSSKSESK
ncbi:MAG TPA: hypothetical protein VMW55_07000 [Nitrosopumilaceae archaeon]|jgi:hypothetical protein|nr:hypothetical protein [Nitrosopumilaceae archaeon]